MRYIVITLILANVIYFGWRFLAPGHEPAQPVAASVDKSQIQLIDDDAVVELEPAADIQQTTPTMPEKTEKSADTEPVVVTSTTEETSEASVPLVAQSAVTEPGAPTPVTKTTCLQTPWTRDEEMLAQWRKGLDDSTFETQTQEVETQRRFLVYIPAKATPEQTLERLRELKAMPVESAHINKGEYIGGISLGLFSQPESATAVLKKVHALGINDAKQTVRVLTTTEYRLRRQSVDAASEPWVVCP